MSKRWVGICFAMAMLSCGDDDGASAGMSGSGVNGSKNLKQLSDQDAQKVCSFVRDSYKASLTSERSYCLRQTEPALCEDELPDCMGSGDYEQELSDDWECDSTEASDLFHEEAADFDCSATVAEAEACIRDAHKDVRELYRNATCDILDDVEDRATKPASCNALYKKCRGLELDF